MKKECSHSKYKKQNHERIFQGEVFSYKARICQECQSVLWDNILQKQFNDWLVGLHKTKRHLFQVQYSLSQNAISCIEKLNEQFPGVDQSVLVRALVTINLEIVEEDETILEIIENYIQSNDFDILKDGSSVAKKIQFKPGAMMDILSLSEMLQIKSSKVVEESIYRILLLNIKTDQKMKDFWENIILKNLMMILKAA